MTCTKTHKFSYHEYYDGPCDHEFSVKVPALGDDTRTATVRVSAVGGGTFGHSYTDNYWAYSLTVSGRGEVTHGDALRVSGPATHLRAAREVAAFVAALCYGNAARAGDADDIMYQRLTSFADYEVAPDAADRAQWAEHGGEFRTDPR